MFLTLLSLWSWQGSNLPESFETVLPPFPLNRPMRPGSINH
jgi:hypothetical protein